MDNIVEYDKTRAAIAEAQDVVGVLSIRDKMAALVKFFSSKRDPEGERHARELQLLAEARIGEMSMTLKKKSGGDHKSESRNQKSQGATFDPSKRETLKDAGISKQDASDFERLAKLSKEKLAEAAREGKSARQTVRPKQKKRTRKATQEELKAAGFTPTSARHIDIETGECVSRHEAIKRLGADEVVSAELTKAHGRISELEAEVAQWKADCEALQKGQMMRLSRAAFAQRKALIAKRAERHAAETVPDDKTKESYERRIKNLVGQLATAKSKVATYQANGKTVLSKAERKAILVCLHPDGVLDEGEKAKREHAFKSFSRAIPEPVFDD